MANLLGPSRLPTCEASGLGVLYTEYSALRADTHAASFWSYETRSRERNRPSVVAKLGGEVEYWLERTDPLLTSILPGTQVSLIVNLGDLWAAGQSPMSS